MSTRTPHRLPQAETWIIWYKPSLLRRAIVFKRITARFAESYAARLALRLNAALQAEGYYHDRECCFHVTRGVTGNKKG